jgi:thiamine-phosphate pyrophosphorylase
LIPPARPILSLVLDRSVSLLPPAEAVEAACAAGVDQVQIRERDIETIELLELTEQIGLAARRGAGAHPLSLIVNRRVDIALSVAAAGVHLGFDAMSLEDARRLVGPDKLLGVSAHSPAEVQAAARRGASYVHLAPVFAPLSKSSSRLPLGFGALAEAATANIPVLAQGGIEAHHCAELLQCGAAGIAVTGSILKTRDPGSAAAELRRALDAAPRPRSEG